MGPESGNRAPRRGAVLARIAVIATALLQAAGCGNAPETPVQSPEAAACDRLKGAFALRLTAEQIAARSHNPKLTKALDDDTSAIFSAEMKGVKDPLKCLGVPDEVEDENAAQ